MCSRIEYQNRSSQVTMIGLDFGSTTSSTMVATACVGLSSTTGRMELGSPQMVMLNIKQKGGEYIVNYPSKGS